MRTTFMLAVIAVGFTAMGAGGTEPSIDELSQRIESMEAELAQQRGELSSLRRGMGGTRLRMRRPFALCGLRSDDLAALLQR